MGIWIGPVPKHGYMDKEFIDDPPGHHNADMIYVVDGVPEIRIDYDPKILKENRGVSLGVRQYVGSPGRGKMVTRDVTGEWKLYSGSSPHRQVLWERARQYADAEKLVTPYELAHDVAHLIDEKPHIILAIIGHTPDDGMRAKGQLAMDEHGYIHTGPDELRPQRHTEEMTLDEGRHPTKTAIYTYISQGGKRTYRDIENHMMVSLKWIKRPQALRGYLSEMIREGLITRHGGIYEAIRPPGRREVEPEERITQI